MMRWVAPRASSGQPSGRPVIYVVGEAPPRAGRQPPDRQVAPGTTFYFNQLQNCAVKICRGEQQVSRTFSKAGLGIREYRWLDGTTWRYDMSPPADQDEDPQEMDDQDGDDENMSDQDAQDNGNYQQDQGGDDGKTWNTKSAMKKRPSAAATGRMICKVTVQPDKTRVTINAVQRKGQVIPAKTKPSPATPAGPVYKYQQRHREYSKKYHAVRMHCLSKGLSREKALSQARKAARAHVDCLFA